MSLKKRAIKKFHFKSKKLFSGCIDLQTNEYQDTLFGYIEFAHFTKVRCVGSDPLQPFQLWETKHEPPNHIWYSTP